MPVTAPMSTATAAVRRRIRVAGSRPRTERPPTERRRARVLRVRRS
jgi:hypothetical protein